MPRDQPGRVIRDAVDEQDVEESLEYLLSTAEEAARAVALVETAEDNLRRVRASVVLTSEERSQDRREAEGLTSAAYERALKAREEAITRKVTLQHMRRYHELRIEVWRTFQANQRQGSRV
jgi:hypothetical protein